MVNFHWTKLLTYQAGSAVWDKKLATPSPLHFPNFNEKKFHGQPLDVISGSRGTPISINHGGSGRRTRKNNVNLCREANKGGLNYDV